MKISLKDEYWNCGDGCCLMYTTSLYIDDKKHEQEFSSSFDALVFVLEELLGHEVLELYDEESS